MGRPATLLVPSEARPFFRDIIHNLYTNAVSR